MSPKLFEAAYNGKYPYDLIESDNFDISWERFLSDYDGINVTAPFKDMAFQHADFPSAEVEAIGASNLILKKSDGIYAYNSDYLAIKEIIKEECSRTGRKLNSVLVVGCGGAAKAAAAAAYMLELDTYIANRTLSKAEDFASRLELYGISRPCTAGGSISACTLDKMPDCDMTIYCLAMPVDGISDLNTDIFLEANYRNPAYSAEFFEQNSKNTAYIDGGKWLLMQALTGYSLFTGEEPDLDSMKMVLK